MDEVYLTFSIGLAAPIGHYFPCVCAPEVSVWVAVEAVRGPCIGVATPAGARIWVWVGSSASFRIPPCSRGSGLRGSREVYGFAWLPIQIYINTLWSAGVQEITWSLTVGDLLCAIETPTCIGRRLDPIDLQPKRVLERVLLGRRLLKYLHECYELPRRAILRGRLPPLECDQRGWNNWLQAFTTPAKWAPQHPEFVAYGRLTRFLDGEPLDGNFLRLYELGENELSVFVATKSENSITCGRILASVFYWEFSLFPWCVDPDCWS
jgi:hypothetical protein